MWRSESFPVRSRPTPARRRRALAVVAVALGLSLTASVGSGAQEDPAGGSTTSTTAPDSGRSDPLAEPSGQVAYVTSDGGVWIGNGDELPLRIGEGAALGYAGQAAVAVAPTADLVAWVRADGTLVTAPIAGGAPTVVAGDVSLDWLGREPIFAWDATGDNLAYLAVGTAEQVAPRDGQTRNLEDSESFLVPLPSGVLGNVVKTVARDGSALAVVGDPSLRSYIGITWSLIDPLMVLESVIPGTTDRYTLSLGVSGLSGEGPTTVSADDPDIAPDGSFVVAVGPAKGRQELLRVTLDDLSQEVLVVDDRICNPLISPDATRIVYGAGENCERVMLISAKGGDAFDVTPFTVSDSSTFGAAELGWTSDGHFLTLPSCSMVADEPVCGGAVTFLEPDSGRVLSGFDAVTAAPVRRPLVQDLWVDVDLRGPLQFRGSFPVDESSEGGLVQNEDGPGSLRGELTNGSAVLGLEITGGEGSFVSGTLSGYDPETGVDRDFMVLGRAQLLGIRILSISGIWYATDDLPFATGEFNLALRRR